MNLLVIYWRSCSTLFQFSWNFASSISWKSNYFHVSFSLKKKSSTSKRKISSPLRDRQFQSEIFNHQMAVKPIWKQKQLIRLSEEQKAATRKKKTERQKWWKGSTGFGCLVQKINPTTAKWKDILRNVAGRAKDLCYPVHEFTGKKKLSRSKATFRILALSTRHDRPFSPEESGSLQKKKETVLKNLLADAALLLLVTWQQLWIFSPIHPPWLLSDLQSPRLAPRLEDFFIITAASGREKEMLFNSKAKGRCQVVRRQSKESSKDSFTRLPRWRLKSAGQENGHKETAVAKSSNSMR